jgi:hypothetical protein
MNCRSSDATSSRGWRIPSRRVSQEYNLPHVIDFVVLAALAAFLEVRVEEQSRESLRLGRF